MSEKKEKAKKTEEKVEVVEEKKVDVDDFIARKLKAINEMSNKAKAKALAERVLRNKEVKY